MSRRHLGPPVEVTVTDAAGVETRVDIPEDPPPTVRLTPVPRPDPYPLGIVMWDRASVSGARIHVRIVEHLAWPHYRVVRVNFDGVAFGDAHRTRHDQLTPGVYEPAPIRRVSSTE